MSRFVYEWQDVWCPPKPLVGLATVEKILSRQSVIHCAESRLVIAVIGRGVVDCLCTDDEFVRRDARRFILGSNLARWTSLVGLNPEFVRMIALKSGYLADEDKYFKRKRVKVRMEPENAPALPSGQHTGEIAHA
jgi:hypothetical protein